MYKKLKFLTLLLCLLAGFNAKADDEVWAYHSGQTEPYAKFNKLSAALQNGNLQDDDIIEFHGNTSETTAVTINKRVSIIPFGNNDYTITYTSGSVRLITANCDLTLGAPDMSGTLTIQAQANRPGNKTYFSEYFTGTTNTVNRKVLKITNGTLTMYDGITIRHGGGTTTDETDELGCAVSVREGATFNMYGGKISDCYVNSFKNGVGGGVQIDGGTFNMYGGEISGMLTYLASSGSGYGTAVGIRNLGNFNMYGGKICDNHNYYPSSHTRGTGVGMRSGIFNFCGGEICNNTSYVNNDPGDGAGIFLSNSATLNMYAGSIHHNSITRGTGTSQHKFVEGVGIYVTDFATLNLYGGSICDNTGINGLSYAQAEASEGIGVSVDSDNAHALIGSGAPYFAYVDGNLVERTSSGVTISRNTVDITGNGGGHYCVEDGATEATINKVCGFGIASKTNINFYGDSNITDDIYLETNQVLYVPAGKSIGTSAIAKIHAQSHQLNTKVFQYEDTSVSQATIMEDKSKLTDFWLAPNDLMFVPCIGEPITGAGENRYIIFGNLSETFNLTISKTVIGESSSSAFPFELEVVNKDSSLPDFSTVESLPEGVTCKPGETNVLCFSLSNGQNISIPNLIAIDAVLTLTETSHDGYYVDIEDPFGIYHGDSREFVLSNNMMVNVKNSLIVPGPFYVVSLERVYPTLQQAVDAAATTDEIHVLPCSQFGVTEYDGATYASNVTYTGQTYDGQLEKRVYVNGKSLTFKSINGKNSAPLKDFVIILVGNSSPKSYTFYDLKFTGASIVCIDNQSGDGVLGANSAVTGGFNEIFIHDCYAKTSRTTKSQKLNGVDLGNYSNGCFISSPQQGSYAITKLRIEDNTIMTDNSKGGRCVYGGFRAINAIVKDNVFGGTEESKWRVTSFSYCSERSYQGECRLEMISNTVYASDGAEDVIAYVNSDSNGQSFICDIHENEVFTPSGNKTTYSDGSPIEIAWFTANGIGTGNSKLVAYHNYYNGRCNNNLATNSTSSTLVIDLQHGHTSGDGHIHECGYGLLKAEDTYQNDWADDFTGGEHHDYELGTAHYCDRCDEFEMAWPGYVNGVNAEATEADYKTVGSNVEIYTENGFAWLVNVVNGKNGAQQNSFEGKTVTLKNDLDMTAYRWMSIGTSDTQFKGTFDGGGHIITGLWNDNKLGEPGIFGYVSGNGVIKNTFVKLDPEDTKHPIAYAAGYYGIIADTIAGSATVHSSEAMGTLEAANANAHIGGVVGLASGSSEVHSVISYATLNGDDKGGIVNKLDGAGLKNSYAKFSQFTSGKELVATNNSGTVDNCYYVQGTTQKMSDATDFTIPGTWPYGYGVSGCIAGTDRMVDKMNAWVNGSDKYAAWAQPTTNGINGDCPVLKLKDFNTMASNDAPYIYYGDLDNKLDYANILFYGQKVGSSAYSGTNLYIDQDAALKTSGTLKANVGVPSGKTYGWHMFSTSLSDAPLGINYTGYVNVGNDYGTPQTQVSFTEDNGYFPTNSPYANWDFYCFDESNSTWVNYKRNTGDHFDTYTHGHIPFENETTLVSGRGYLMALKDMTYVQAYGTLNNANVNATVTYSGHHVKGCNFIGNPYHAYLDFDAFCTANSGKLASNSYAMIVSNGTTSDYITYAPSSSKNPDQASRYIHPHQGFIVKVNDDGTLSFTPDQAVVDQTSPYREEHLDYPLVNLFATDSEGNREIATAELGRPDNGGALKIDDMLTGKGSLAISNEGQRYAIAFIEGQPNEVAVHFIANEDGDFTMSWNTHNGTFSYLHLVDNMTGMDVDCLASDEYKFTAHAGDYASRFKLKFEFTGVDEDNAAESSEEFAFFHQGSLVVNGQGSLELIDLNGRTLMSKRLENVQSMVTLPEVSEGLYLLRLADDSNVKTQKIIIKK